MDNYNNQNGQYGQNTYNQDYSGYGNGSYGNGVNSSLVGDNNQYSYGGAYNGSYNGSYNGYNGYDMQPGKKKLNKKKLLIILGIVFVVMIALAISIFKVAKTMNETFDIDDFDAVNQACENVFGGQMEYTTVNVEMSGPNYRYIVKNVGEVEGTTQDVNYNISWMEFDSDSSANGYMTSMENMYDAEHEKNNGIYGASSRITTNTKMEWSYTLKDSSDEKHVILIAKHKKYIVKLILDGEKEQVSDLYEDFKKKIK